ncbi:MAG: chemotaxis protein CheX [Calditrichaeota bacterium]|nr:chemotaxis protein CheX [Calditrichota bacterium]
MHANLEHCVLTAASKVFETSAFLTVYPLEEGQELPTPEQGATMQFRGEAAGRVSIRIAVSVLDEIVQNLLEVESEEEFVQRRSDVLKEMLNMITGNLLTEYFGSGPVFDLSPPEFLGEQPFPQPTSEDVQYVALNVENTLAEVMFEVQNSQNS